MAANIDPKKNFEGYLDPTASEALQNVNDEYERFHKLIRTLLYTCKVAGFEVGNRIVLIDKKTGRVWR